MGRIIKGLVGSIGIGLLLGGCGKGAIGESVPHPKPVATDFSVSVDEDSSVAITNAMMLAHVSDDSKVSLDVVALRGGSLGVLSKTDDGYVYQTNPDANGVDTLSFEVKDSADLSAVGEIRVTINPLPDAPVAAPASLTLNEDTFVELSMDTVASKVSDPDVGEKLELTDVSLPAHGRLDKISEGTFRYVPQANYSGNYAETLNYTVTDREALTSTATLTIHITPVNDPPTAESFSVTTDEDAPIAIDASTILAHVTDVDGETPRIVSVEAVANGTIAGVGAGYQFTPTPNTNEQGKVKFTIQDAAGLSGTGYVTITIKAIPDSPVASNFSLSTKEDIPLNIAHATVLANTSDPDPNDTISISAMGSPVNGKLSSSADGYTYIPNPNYYGVESIGYTVKDGQGNTASAVMTLNVNSRNWGAPTTLAAGVKNFQMEGWQNGDRIVIWEGVDTKIYSRFYSSSAGWVGASKIVSNVNPTGVITPAATVPRLAILADNHAAAVWVQNGSVFARIFDYSTRDWLAPIQLNELEPAALDGSIKNSVISRLDIRKNSAGDLLVVWLQNLQASCTYSDPVSPICSYQNTPYPQYIWYKKYDHSQGWRGSLVNLGVNSNSSFPIDMGNYNGKLPIALSKKGDVAIEIPYPYSSSLFSDAYLYINNGASIYLYTPSNVQVDLLNDNRYYSIYEAQDVDIYFREVSYADANKSNIDANTLVHVWRQSLTMPDSNLGINTTIDRITGRELEEVSYGNWGNDIMVDLHDYVNDSALSAPTIYSYAQSRWAIVFEDVLRGEFGNGNEKNLVVRLGGKLNPLSGAYVGTKYLPSTQLGYAKFPLESRYSPPGIDDRNNVYILQSADPNSLKFSRFIATSRSYQHVNILSSNDSNMAPKIEISAKGEALGLWQDKSGNLVYSVFQ